MLDENRRPIQIWVGSQVVAFLISLLVCAVVCTQVSFAQGATAAIRGTVADQQGSVIPGVVLNLTNLDMQESRTSITNEDGQYTFASITPGRYSLTASKAGFATVTLPNFELAVNQSATHDFQLQIGSTASTITVSTASVSINTSSTELGTVIETEEVNSLPLNGRNFTEMLAITPGVSPISTGQNAGGGGGWAGDAVGSFTFPSVNGQTSRSNMFLLDGFTDYAFIGNYAVQPIIDAIQEFKVQSHNDSPAYGGSMGGVVNVVSQGGTTHYHGDLWEFIRNNDFDSTNLFNTVVTPYKQNQFGAVAGGPVFPRVKNPRLAKTYVFGGYEGFRSTRAAAALGVVPTPQQLAGDFSGITNQLYDPFSTVPDPAKPGQYLRTPFPNNNISSRLDPNMVTYAKAMYPAPEVTGVAGRNYRDNTPNTLSSNIYTLRADHEFTSQFSSMFRLTKFSQNADSASGIGPNITNGNPVNGYLAGITLTWASKSGDMIVTGQFGRTKAFTLLVSDFAPSIQNAWQAAHFNPLYASGFSGGISFDPGQEFSDFVTIPNGIYEGNDIAIIWDGAGDVTWVKGKHTLQAGLDINTNNTQLPILEVEQQYLSFQTSNLESTTPSGNDFASFLLGVPAYANRRNVTVETHGGWVDGFYVADKWRVSRKLTINPGFRYDITLWPVYGNKKLGDQFLGDTDLLTGQYWMASVPPACSAGVSPCIPGGVLPPNVIVTDQANGAILHNVKDNIQPRLGIAYEPRPGTVIRATGGRFFDNWASALQLSTNYEGTWPDTAFLAVSNLNTTVPTVTAEDPLSEGSGAVIIPAPTPWGQVNYMVDPYYKDANSYQWNLGVQQQVGKNTVAEVDYVGSHSLRLDFGAVRNTAVIPGPGPTAPRSPFPYITPTNFDTSDNSANYNAFQAQVRTVIGTKFTFLGAYTWSKVIDDGCDGFFGGEGCSIQNVYNRRADRSVGGSDIPQMFTVTSVYHLPFGKGEKFNISNPVVNTIAGGWAADGIFTTRSGQAFNARASGDIANVGAANGIRPNITCNPYTSPRSQQYLNKSCFSTPAPFTFGDEGRNGLRSAHVTNLDFSVEKSFRIPLSEQTRLEFRTDFFNIANAAPFGIPSSGITSSTFGSVTTTALTEREIQFALKLYY